MMLYIVEYVQKSDEKSKATPKTKNRENTEPKELTLVVNNGTKSNVVLFSEDDQKHTYKKQSCEDDLQPGNEPKMYSIRVNNCLHTAV